MNQKQLRAEINRCLKNARSYRDWETRYKNDGNEKYAKDSAKQAKYWETKAADLENPPVQKFQLLCVWCGAPWTETMIQVESNSSHGCDTCGHGGGSYGKITIKCDSCQRDVFIKEFDER